MIVSNVIRFDLQGIKAIEDLISPVLLSEDIEDATLKLGLTPQLSQIIVDRLQNVNNLYSYLSRCVLTLDSRRSAGKKWVSRRL